MIVKTDKELTESQMGPNTLENLKMANDTEKEPPDIQMEELIMVSGKKID